MLEKIGLGAVVQFDGGQAISGMRALGDEAEKMNQKVASGSSSSFGDIGSKVGSGLVAFGAGAAATGAALLPLTLGLENAESKAADFEQAMSFVQSKLMTTPENMALLTDKAKEMGLTTKFSAVEAADGMEILAAQGLDTQQILASVGGIANAAAADNITFAQAADKTTEAMHQFNLQASDIPRIADVLAAASAKSASTMLSMGEGIKYVGQTAQQLGVTLPETAAMLGVMADAGLKGSVGGTALRNALIKLADPTKKGRDAMALLGIEVQKTADGNMDMAGTFSNVIQGISKTKDNVQATAAMSELLGIRGAPAVAAFRTALTRTMEVGGKQVPRFEGLLAELNQQMQTGGAASEMAATRMDNFHGAMTRLKNVMTGFDIEAFFGFLPGMKGTIMEVVDGITQVTRALQIMNDPKNENSLSDERWKGISANARAVAQGIKDGLDIVHTAIQTVKDAFHEAFAFFGEKEGPDTIRQIAKIATVLLIVAAAAAPILLALGAVAAFVGGVLVPIFTFGGEAIMGIISAVAGAFGWVLAAIGVVVLAIEMLRGENESFGQAAMRIWNGIAEVFSGVIDYIVAKFNEVREYMSGGLEYLGAMWARFTAFVSKEFKELFGFMLMAWEYISPLVTGILDLWVAAFKNFAAAAAYVLGDVLFILGEIFSFIKEIVVAIAQGLIMAIHDLAKMVVAAAQAIHVSLPQGLIDFANQADFKPTSLEAINAANNFGAKDVGQQMADENVADKVATQVADVTATKMDKGKTQVDVKVDDNRKLDINNCVNFDGRKVGQAQAVHQQEVNERRGFKAQPWQKRVILEQGSTANVGM